MAEGGQTVQLWPAVDSAQHKDPGNPLEVRQVEHVRVSLLLLLLLGSLPAATETKCLSGCSRGRGRLLMISLLAALASALPLLRAHWLAHSESV